MANQQNQQNQQGQQNQQRATPDANGEVSRSEDLLPAGAADNTADGRFNVAEEVNLDQQSDSTRRVGQAPKGIASDALADSLQPEKLKGDDGQDSQGSDV
jgi:hypothetical protein